MKRLLILALTCGSAAAFATPYYYQGDLTLNSPTYDNGGAGGAPNAYSVFAFTVSAAGAYTFEMASPNSLPAGSDAVDTYLELYTGSFNPLAPGAPTSSNDDYSSTFTVLPGPYAIGNTGTGFTGALPASRLASVALTTATTYYLINTSYRPNNYVGTGTNGLGIGHFYQGIDGPGTITAVPEPASMAALGLGALALLRRRKKA